MLQTLLDSCAALGVPLTAAQAEQPCDFGARLLEQNRVMNLTAITEPQAVAKLHFADCLALLRIVPFSGKRVIDVGCGAGFPGVPLKLGEPSLEHSLLLRAYQAQLRVFLFGKLDLAALELLTEFLIPYLTYYFGIAGFVDLKYLAAFRAFYFLHIASSSHCCTEPARVSVRKLRRMSDK